MHCHLDCNYPFIFFYVTVLFVMGSFTRLAPELALRGFACHPGPGSARLFLMLISRSWFSTKFSVMSEFFENLPLAATTYSYVYPGGSTLRPSDFHYPKEQVVIPNLPLRVGITPALRQTRQGRPGTTTVSRLGPFWAFRRPGLQMVTTVTRSQHLVVGY